MCCGSGTWPVRSSLRRAGTATAIRQRITTTVRELVRPRASVYCLFVTTRAIVAYASSEGTWKGVWNDTNSEPQQLGRVLLRRIASLKGNLEAFAAQYVDGCPEGWVALDKAERCADPIGLFGGTFDGVVATCDPTVNPLCFDAQYLYLLHPPKRRMFVLQIENRPIRPFGMVTFDPAGKAKPNKFPVIEAED